MTRSRKKGTGNDPSIPDVFFSELIELIQREHRMGNITDKNDVHSLKLRLCKRYHLPFIPGDPEILRRVAEGTRKELQGILRLKPMRTASGVSPVAVMTSPADCPHGVCIYCPGGVDSGSPQSYTGQEPAALRGGQHGFDPYFQTKNRLMQYREIGHPADKIDLIVMGGTFPSRPIEYQDSFILGCFNAMNCAPASPDLETAHLLNERAPHRCIGLTIETRPDRCLAPEIRQIKKLGGTRVELGVQTTSDRVLESVNRGHGTAATRQATRLIKDAGLKLVYHIMPGLPGSTPEMDMESFRTIFQDPDYRPDMLKIYPTLVIEGTRLHEMWEQGTYIPLDTDGAVSLLKEVKKIVPSYVRIQRIQRDIPARLISAGVRKSNLRQLIHSALAREGERCHCIRCREAGHTLRKADHVEFLETSYAASGGTEHFLSFEDVDNEVLIGFLRLRFPSSGAENHDQGRAIVRELRVVGTELPLGKKGEPEDHSQHTGYGRKLLERAEEIARLEGMERIIVTSGVGVRPYYRKFGYERSGPSMEKEL